MYEGPAGILRGGYLREAGLAEQKLDGLCTRDQPEFFEAGAFASALRRDRPLSRASDEFSRG